MSGTEHRQWFAVDVTTAPEAIEAVEHAFNVLGSIGTEISDLHRSTTANASIAGYFKKRPADDEVAGAVAAALEIYGRPSNSILSIKTRVVPETDWLAEWKKHWQPTIVGKFVIAPPWSDVKGTGKMVIRIEPGMAFGTGTHETTQLCLQTIGECLGDEMSFMDIGTGTGILAIAAAKLSLSKITACDTDADSIKIARENASANGVADRIEFLHDSISSDSQHYDLVCANLTLDVITPLLPALLQISNQRLLLSGILAEQEATIRNELARFEISNLKLKRAGEWISALISKS